MEMAYKYRIYPDAKQKIIINKTFGCVRYVYNHFLHASKEHMYGSYEVNSRFLTLLKRSEDTAFLKDPDKFALQNALKDLDCAYKNFFAKSADFPVFKNKRNQRFSYRTNFTNNNIEIVQLPVVGKKKTNWVIKLPKVGRVPLKLHRKLVGRILNVTVSRTPTDKYFVSVCVKRPEHEKLGKRETSLGIDLGIKDYLVGSDGRVVKNPKHLLKYQAQLARLQRQLALKEKGSNNYRKTMKKIAKVHEKVSNSRKDFLHKLSISLVRENQSIFSESLKVKEMLKSDFAKWMSDASWSRFLGYLKYKAEWYGSSFVQVDTYFPSTQLCSKCGFKNEALRDLSIRKWTCPACRKVHNRDHNASINIENEGLRIST